MKTLKVLAACAAVVMIFAVVAEQCEAQGRGGRGGRGGFGARGGGSMVNLLGIEEVRKELGLKEDVAQKLADLAEDVQEEMRAEMRDIMADFRDMDEDERADAQKEMREIATKINSDAQKEVGKLINDKQMARLKQLFVQQQGVNALQNADIQKELGISKEQQEKISKVQQELNTEMREEMREMFSGGGGGIDREALMEMREEFQEKIEKSVMGALTAGQKEKFAKMKGKEFKFPERRRGGRGR